MLQNIIIIIIIIVVCLSNELTIFKIYIIVIYIQCCVTVCVFVTRKYAMAVTQKKRLNRSEMRFKNYFGSITQRSIGGPCHRS
jgi:Ca2+/Na+ antiporter